MRFILLLSCLVAPVAIQAQVDQISGMINHYASVLAIDQCTARIDVSDTTGFRTGETIILIQMKGAAISGANNAGFGTITNLNGAGQFERVVIDSVTAGALFARYQLLHGYDLSAAVQVVTVPQYTNAIVTDTLRPLPWNGTIGGVLALSVENTLTLDAPIVADGTGFRGGAAFVAPVNNCTWLLGESDYYYSPGGWRGGYKGEGIAVPDTNKVLGRGPQANGGGGGNDHNSGGGGGGNAGAGGLGGDNDEPSAFGCDGYFPGLGGRLLQPDTSRLFAGGGGGAGHANNNITSYGGNGGGIIIIGAGRVNGLKPVISAQGWPGSTANGDGGGGGGAGGTIWLNAGMAPDSLKLIAGGGPGGNTINNNQNRCFGPGGGGGGGCIRTNLPGIAVPSGAAAGVITGSSNSCVGSTSGALAGMPGVVLPLPAAGLPGGVLDVYPEILAEPEPKTVCAGEAVEFSVVVNSGDWQFQWEMNTGAGWLPVDAGTGLEGFNSLVLRIPAATSSQNGYRFRCVVQRPGCGSLTSAEAILQVSPAPQAGFKTTLNNTTVIFENQSLYADTYWWDFGDGASSSLVAPQHTYTAEGVYTVTLYAISTCDTVVFTQILQLLLAPVAGFSAPDSVIDCEAIQVAFANQSSANAIGFIWFFPGGVPATSTDANPVVTYPVSGTYPVTLIAVNAAGSDTVIQEIVVQVLGFPEADFSFTLLNGGWVAFTNLSVNADSYTWYFGDSTVPVQTRDALHQFAQGGVFTVTLVVDNFCGTAVLQQTIEIILTKVKEPGKQHGIRLFPNPANEQIVVDLAHWPAEPVGAQIYDLHGRVILEQTLHPGGGNVMPLGNLPPGVYYIGVRAEKNVYMEILLRQ